MSYGKPQDQPYVYDYDAATRPTQDPSYASYAQQPQPTFDSQNQYTPSTHPAEPHGLQLTHQMPFLGAPFEPRDSPAFQAPAPAPAPFIAGRPPYPIELTSSGPYHGTPGDKLRITFRSQSEYQPQKFSFILMFGFQSIRAGLSKGYYQQPYWHYTLSVDVPQSTPDVQTMPLLLDIQDENATTLEHKSLGNFVYDISSGYQQYGAVEERRKRKISEETTDYLQSSPKRSASQPLHPHPSGYKDSSAVYSGQQMSSQIGSPYSSTLFAMPPYDRPAPHQRSSYGQPLQQRPSYGYSMSPNLAPSSMKIRSPHSGYGSYASASLRSPRMASTPRVTAAALSRSASATSNPPLVRTTILKPPPPPVTPQQSYAPSHSFNPYAIYPNAKAMLNIVGELQTMCNDWTKEEKAAQRRLVEFQRSQTGSTITTSFKAVSPEERSPNNPCISCIWWEKKGQCFVTSVDTIALLEALVAVRFTVEEKNRIRRNLEGFKPYTVSKAKDECDDIFRLIMGFPNPKPRNIEKDIKIFPWSILTSALKKIISKYSASYASTSSLITPSAASYGSTVTEGTAHEHAQPTASPASTTSSSVPAAYQAGMTSTAMSPNLAAGDMRSTMSQLVPPGAQHLGQQWQTAQYPSQYHQGLPLPAPTSGRPSWDMAPFLEPQGGTSAAGQGMAYSYRTTSERTSEHTSNGGAPHHYHPTTRT